MHFKAAAGPEHYGQIPQSIAPIHAPILVPPPLSPGIKSLIVAVKWRQTGDDSFY